jgi:hypothetical protein
MKEDFYHGFEGEPEIRIEARSRANATLTQASKLHRCVRMWVGYFEDLLERVQPGVDGHTGMAHAYHNAEGWYDESPWHVPDVASALTQWKAIDVSQLDRTEKSVHAAVVALLCEAFEVKHEVYIYWE